MKIDKLTSEQEADLLAYREEWLRIGRSTEPACRNAAEVAIRKMYHWLGMETPRFWWCDGPAVGSLVRTLLGDNLWANLGDNLWDNLGNNLGDNLWDNLGDNLGDNLRANLRDNLGANLWANLGDNLGDNLRANLRANLGANLGANLRDNLRANLDWGFWGAHESYWPAHYAWPHRALRKMHSDEQSAKLAAWLEISTSCGWWHPFKGVCFICERPSVQAVDENGRLHMDGGPALLCRDSWPVFALHGIRVKEEYVITPAERLAPETVLSEQNADVRRELLRKIGIERMLAKLTHRSLSKRGNYEVLSVALSSEVSDARYLRMVNPSVGCFHLEGIPPECDTVEKALNWRNNQWFSNAEILT